MSARPAPPPSPAAEDHLKAILHLERGEGEPRRAGTSAPAGLLGVTPASACTMLARLARLGLVDHRPRRGARLTVAGRCVAEAVVERGRVVPPLRAYGLPSEPWLFTIDRRGRVAARLEGSFGIGELRQAIERALR
jgi:hypothetical protein